MPKLMTCTISYAYKRATFLSSSQKLVSEIDYDSKRVNFAGKGKAFIKTEVFKGKYIYVEGIKDF